MNGFAAHPVHPRKFKGLNNSRAHTLSGYGFRYAIYRLVLKVKILTFLLVFPVRSRNPGV